MSHCNYFNLPEGGESLYLLFFLILLNDRGASVYDSSPKGSPLNGP